MRKAIWRYAIVPGGGACGVRAPMCVGDLMGLLRQVRPMPVARAESANSESAIMGSWGSAVGGVSGLEEGGIHRFPHCRRSHLHMAACASGGRLCGL